MSKTQLFWFCVLCLIPAVVYAQPSGALKDGQYFEGSISFSVRTSGPLAADLRELNDIVSMTWHLKGANYIIQQQPSVASMSKPGANFLHTVRLFIADSNQLYSMDLENRIAYKFEPGVDPRPRRPPVAKPLNDSLKILGHMCYAYQVVKSNQETVTYYVSPKFQMDLAPFKGKYNAKISFLTRGLNGYIPLKTVIRKEGLVSEVTATKIVPQKLNEGEFQIPPRFKIKKYDVRRG